MVLFYIQFFVKPSETVLIDPVAFKFSFVMKLPVRTLKMRHLTNVKSADFWGTFPNKLLVLGNVRTAII